MSSAFSLVTKYGSGYVRLINYHFNTRYTNEINWWLLKTNAIRQDNISSNSCPHMESRRNSFLMGDDSRTSRSNLFHTCRSWHGGMMKASTDHFNFLFGVIMITSMTLLTSLLITTLNVGLHWHLFGIWLRSFAIAISFSLPVGLAMSIITRKILKLQFVREHAIE